MRAGAETRQERLHDWDFSRALYLVLGIPFHAAVAYSLTHEWAISSPDKSQALTWFANFIHTFRMPGFFMLAGIFSMMLLDRQGPWPWLKGRLFRLGLPLISATILILPFQIAMQSLSLAVTGVRPYAALPGDIMAGLSNFGEPWISHLWFLWALIAYCIGLALLQALSRGTLRRRLSGFAVWVGNNRVLSLAAFAAICELAARAQSLVVEASPYYGNAVINYNQYAVFFAFGALVYASRSLGNLLLRPGPLALTVGVVLVTLSQGAHHNIIDHTLRLMAALVGAILIVGFISGLARRHFSRADPRVRKLVDASFTIYLFHHPVIFVLATLFLLVDLPPVLEFLVIAPLAGLISYAIHLGIRRSAVLMLMFNGVRPKRREAEPALPEPRALPVARPWPSRG